MARPASVPTTPGQRAGLGTFAGVFTPSILTILGLILFLRLGFVVGSAGLGRAILIVGLANLISVLTSLSLSAIATNFRVKGGGDYYLISRTLGVEFGGALGLVLFAAQSVSIAFYLIGFAEAVQAIAGWEGVLAQRATACAALAPLFLLAWLGADWATRAQYAIMGVLAAALAAFFVGALPAWDGARLSANLAPAGELPFWAVFALFFPAVTGFTQGVSMSGDLADPGKSLPRGTFAAVWISFAVYLLVAVTFAAVVDGRQLVEDTNVMRSISAAPWLIDAGVIAATLSSALASFLGAPRILQSLASDQVFPWLAPFAKGHGESGNPRRGVLLAGALGLAGILLGELDLIAPVVTMFFLISYGLLNYATWYEARARSPSFRPRFRWFNAYASLAGALGCAGVVLAIAPFAGAAAFAVLMGIRLYISRRAVTSRWADGKRSARFQRVRDELHAMDGELEHPRDWRPSILAFSDDPARRERLLRLATWIEGQSGMTTIVRLLEGEGAAARVRRADVERDLRAELRGRDLDAFALAVVAPDPLAAFPALLQSYGIGPVRANIVLLNWFDQEDARGAKAPGMRAYGRILRTALRFDCNVLILHAVESALERLREVPADRRRIDLWWTGDATSRLLLLLAHLIQRSEDWVEAELRVLAPVPPGGDEGQALEELEQLLVDVRIEARARTTEPLDEPTLLAESADASLVLLPFRLKDETPVAVFEAALPEVLERLPLAVLGLAAHDIHLDAGPDEGAHAEAAEAEDQAAQARRRAALAVKEVAATEKRLAKAEAALEKAGQDAEAREPRERERDEAREALREAERKQAREEARAKILSGEAEQAREPASPGAAGEPPEDPSG